jgi:hypothetical protein
VTYPHLLTVVSADSQETVGENAPATNAIDGDPGTIWHTKWTGTAAPYPHEIQGSSGRSPSSPGAAPRARGRGRAPGGSASLSW